jgi:hypothetical protein
VSQSVCLSQRVLPVTQSKEGGGHAPMGVFLIIGFTTN